jgi:hypothetical protein
MRVIGRSACVFALGLALLTACTPKDVVSGGPEKEPAPKVGACRVLEPHDIDQPSNDSDVVSCKDAHTAETFRVGTFHGKLADASYDSPSLGAAVYRDCNREYMKFTGADDSLALRTILSWAWYRPSEDAWKAGSRWYRCDVVGGTNNSSDLVDLPQKTKGVLLGIPPDKWMACVNGPTVTDAVRIPCTDKHMWRAVTTIVVGQPKQKYPGDRLVEVQTRDYCSDSVGAWLNYPIDYKYAYTWFHKDEWLAGNRRSICWAGTHQ